MPTWIIEDDFTRANNASLGTAVSGQSWAVATGLTAQGWKIDTNKAVQTGAGENANLIGDAALTRNIQVQIGIEFDAGAGTGEFMVFYSAVDGDNLLGLDLKTATGSGPWERVTGAWNSLGGDGSNEWFADGDTCTLDIYFGGEEIWVLRNSVLLPHGTLAFTSDAYANHSAGTKVGIRSANGPDGGGTKLTSFKVANL